MSTPVVERRDTNRPGGRTETEARQRRQRQSAADIEGERADLFHAETSPAPLPSLTTPTPDKRKP